MSTPQSQQGYQLNNNGQPQSLPSTLPQGQSLQMSQYQFNNIGQLNPHQPFTNFHAMVSAQQQQQNLIHNGAVPIHYQNQQQIPHIQQGFQRPMHYRNFEPSQNIYNIQQKNSQTNGVPQNFSNMSIYDTSIDMSNNMKKDLNDNTLDASMRSFALEQYLLDSSVSSIATPHSGNASINNTNNNHSNNNFIRQNQNINTDHFLKIEKEQEPTILKHQKPSKPMTQYDVDLRILLNNVESLFTLRELSTEIRALLQIEKPKVASSKIEDQSKITEEMLSSTLGKDEFQKRFYDLPSLKKLQLFGISWLKQACKVLAKGHVPRNKIFSKYVTICADYGMTSLSPALFGKLIRMIYPEITIHRYGVRGQSKYHYCGITIIEDGIVSSLAQSPGGIMSNTTSSTSLIGLNGSRNGSMSNISTLFRSSTPNEIAKHHHRIVSRDFTNSETGSPLRSVFDIDSTMNLPVYSVTEFSPSYFGDSPAYSIQNNNSSNNPRALQSRTPSETSISFSNVFSLGNFQLVLVPEVLQSLEFALTSPNNNSSSQENIVLNLPQIEPYIKLGTSHDIAMIFHLLYKSYCCTIFESIRFLRIKQLVKTLNAFQRSLTNPVFKLYVTDSLLPWILKSDMVLYDALLSFIYKAVVTSCLDTTQLAHLQEIINIYVPTIADNITTLPQKMVSSKANMAKKFASLALKAIDISRSGSVFHDMLVNNNTINIDKIRELWLQEGKVDLLIKNTPLLSLLGSKYSQAYQGFVKMFEEDIPEFFSQLKIADGSISVNKIIGPLIHYILDFACLMTGNKNPVRNIHTNGTTVQQQYIQRDKISSELLLLSVNILMDQLIKRVVNADFCFFRVIWELKSCIFDTLVWYGELCGFICADKIASKRLNLVGSRNNIAKQTNSSTNVTPTPRTLSHQQSVASSNTNMSFFSVHSLAKRSQMDRDTDASNFDSRPIVSESNNNNNNNSGIIEVATENVNSMIPDNNGIIHVSPRKKIRLNESVSTESMQQLYYQNLKAQPQVHQNQTPQVTPQVNVQMQQQQSQVQLNAQQAQIEAHIQNQAMVFSSISNTPVVLNNNNSQVGNNNATTANNNNIQNINNDTNINNNTNINNVDQGSSGVSQFNTSAGGMDLLDDYLPTVDKEILEIFENT